MPTNLYGPGDNYHPKNSHVLPALIRRFHEAKMSGAESVTCWGTGSPMKSFCMWMISEMRVFARALAAKCRSMSIYECRYWP